MPLDSDDIGTLTSRVRVENRMRMLIPYMLVADAVAAVFLYLVLESPANYIAAPAMIVIGLAGTFVLSRSVGAGNAKQVLDGMQPTAWMRVEAIGDRGRPPYTWSFRILDEPGRFVHASASTTRDFEFRAGEQYLLYGFGDPDKPYGKTVYFTDVQQTRRHWDFRVQLSDEEWSTVSTG
ncbi:hypothetical protein LX16_2047 [Stackebrandtia albiflava]|uniref:Uncharacterized protein n=1 Tax=Stackebrandtia albiflava TaxID=406432 RepID=A0A562VEN1_9ACTN|nr:hypothetical protein [Stackebrandtia albiflava]TWJ16318.1 hypothetical protein LX16_2047 [Stackebrandtia albiflava]